MGLEKNLGDVGWTGRLFLWCTCKYGMLLACALARGSSGVTLHGRVIPLSHSPSVALSTLLEVSGHGLCRSGRLRHACSVSASAFPPLILTKSFGKAGRFLSNCLFHSTQSRSLREETIVSVNPPSQIAVDRRCRGEKLARKTSQFLPSSSPVSRFQPLYCSTYTREISVLTVAVLCAPL